MAGPLNDDDLTTCTAFVWEHDRSLYCGQPALGVSIVACLHEHVGRRGICADCAVTMQRMAWDDSGDDPLICTVCDEGPAPHDCPVISRIEWNSGQVTVMQNISAGVTS